jgi:hypothetical protein
MQYSARRVRPARSTDEGVESNSRLTGATGAVLLVLLAAEGVTIVSVRSMISAHVFIGMLLIPPVALKIGTTGWRFFRYYRGDAAYLRKGPPPVLLRLLGPFVVVLTVVVLASGVALILAPRSWRHPMLVMHKAGFVLWFGAMTVHVVGHLVETARLAPLDWLRRTRGDVSGATARVWVLTASVAAGLALGAVMLGPASRYLGHHFGFGGG